MTYAAGNRLRGLEHWTELSDRFGEYIQDLDTAYRLLYTYGGSYGHGVGAFVISLYKNAKSESEACRSRR